MSKHNAAFQRDETVGLAIDAGQGEAEFLQKLLVQRKYGFCAVERGVVRYFEVLVADQRGKLDIVVAACLRFFLTQGRREGGDDGAQRRFSQMAFRREAGEVVNQIQLSHARGHSCDAAGQLDHQAGTVGVGG